MQNPDPTSLAARPATLIKHYEDASSWTDAGDGSKHWIARAENFVIAVANVQAGTQLPRNNPDEYMVLLPEGVGARFEAEGESLRVSGDSLVIVPPGQSRITVEPAGDIYRFFTSRCADLVELSVNAADYAAGTPGVAPLVEWPMPIGGYRLRAYALADYLREGFNMRVFRSRSLMINVFAPQATPRDTRKMTPHAHQDFEQGALTLR